MRTRHFDVLVIGSGPAGQQAALHAARGGLSTAICEQHQAVGGTCVHYGTIPSKALRERAVRSCGEGSARSRHLDQGVSVADLIGEVGHIVRTQDRFIAAQLAQAGVERIHGRARFESADAVHIAHLDGTEERVDARHFVVATGSLPRRVPEVIVDHEYVYDSDSVLSLPYLPRTLTVLGGGVIACEYASIFALLGVDVTIVDRAARPLAFLDEDLSHRFLEDFSAMGGVFRGGVRVAWSGHDGIAGAITRLEDGGVIASDKVFCALGRVAELRGLQIENAGIGVDERGLIPVDAHCRSRVSHIYAVGDVIGPPSLASAAMEQGRRAARHLLGHRPDAATGLVPTGIYSIPELAAVGLTEDEARKRFPLVVTGVARFGEVARGQIAGTESGFLKVVVSGDRRIRGIHLAGAQATELVHMGQMALIHEADVDVFLDNVFNFPTYGECFRIAAQRAADELERCASGPVRAVSQARP